MIGDYDQNNFTIKWQLLELYVKTKLYDFSEYSVDISII